jgi:hypothetical protein
LHIQVFYQYFHIEIDSLGASWAGCWFLFRHWYWIHLCTQMYRSCWTWLGPKNTEENGEKSFRVEKEGDEYVIRGICCPHTPRVKEAVLEECWTGKILLVESNGEWMRLFRRNKTGKEVPSGIMVNPEETAEEAKGVGARVWLRLRRFLGNLGVKDLESSEQAL